MKKFYISAMAIFIVLAGDAYIAGATEIRPPTDANIYGHVIDSVSGEHIPFVNLLVKGTRIGTITDASGHYILTNLPPGRHTLIIQSMGYAREEINVEVVAQQSREVNIILKSTGIDLEEVVHTSSPTASGFRYQPDAVFMGEELQRRSEPSFGEMLNGQPGVAMRSFGSAPSRPVIRGMDGDRILVLENGERMGDIAHTSADHSISLDPLVANRVEVVRGPASLLYGSSALGGVINLMTTDIPEQWDMGLTGVVSGQGATMNSMGAGFGRLTLGGNKGSAVSARFAMRQAGNISTPDGELPGTTMRNYDGAVGWGLNSNTIDGGMSLSFSNQAFEIPDSPDTPDESIEIRARRLSWQGRFGTTIGKGFFDKAQLRFSMSKFDQQEVSVYRQGGAVDENTELEYDMVAFSSTFTLQHKAQGIFARGALGFNASGQRVDVIGADIYTPGEQRMSLATFTFQEVPLSNQLRFQFGIRLDYNNSKAISNESFPVVSQSRSSVNYSGSVGLNYRPLEGIEIGGQAARSHRNPMVEELFANGPHLGAGVYERGNVNLKDEIGHGADLFIRYSTAVVALELTGFVNNFSNYIIFQPTPDIHEPTGYPVFEYLGGEARLAGSEFSIAWNISSQLTLNSSVDYVNGKRIVEDGPDENLPVIPPLRISNTLEYDFGWGWLGTTYRIINKQDLVAPEEEVTEGYNLLSFQAGYRLNMQGRHVLILRVDNALDTRYRDHLSRIEDRNYLMPGRNFNLTYRWFF